MSSEKKILSLNKDGILEYQKNRPPYLMIDYVTEVIPERVLRDIKI